MIIVKVTSTENKIVIKKGDDDIAKQFAFESQASAALSQAAKNVAIAQVGIATAQAVISATKASEASASALAINLAQNIAFKGGATLATIPNLATGPQTWQATVSGTYTNMGGLVVNLADGVIFLNYDGTNWRRSTTPIIANGQVIAGNVPAVSGGTVFNALIPKFNKNEGDVNNFYSYPFFDGGITDLFPTNIISYPYTIEKNDVFNYEGYKFVMGSTVASGSVDFRSRNGSDLDRAIASKEFNGKIYLVAEATYSINATIIFQNYTGNTTTGVNTNIVFIANLPKTMVIEMTISNPNVSVNNMRFLIFNLISGENLTFGRFGLFTGLAQDVDFSTLLNNKIKYKNNQSFLNNQSQELGGFYGWKDLIGNDIFLPNTGAGSTVNFPTNHPFGYEGKCLNLVGKDAGAQGDFRINTTYAKLKLFNDYKPTPLGVHLSILVELYSDIDEKISINLEERDSVLPDPNRAISDIILKAGVPKIQVIKILIKDFNETLLIKFNRLGQNLKVGRIAFYLKEDVNTIDNPYEVAKKAVREHANDLHTSGKDQVYWGDSLTSRNLPEFVAQNPDVNVEVNGFGGYHSTQLAQMFLNTTPDINKFYIFWVGNNNFFNTYDIIADVKQMVEHCGTTDYLVLGIVNGNYVNRWFGNSEYNKFIDCNRLLKQAYGDRFFDVREFLGKACDYGNIFVRGTFTQPSIGATVQITVNDTSNTYYSVGKEIQLGTLGEQLGRYTITSINSATLMTLTLVSVGTLAVASTFTFQNNTVDNIYSRPQQLLASTDIADYIIKDIHADYWRGDEIHLSDTGHRATAIRIRQIIKSL